MGASMLGLGGRGPLGPLGPPIIPPMSPPIGPPGGPYTIQEDDDTAKISDHNPAGLQTRLCRLDSICYCIQCYSETVVTWKCGGGG
jgi:hypothetical protein